MSVVVTGSAGHLGEALMRTAQGPRQFQTHTDAWPRELPGGSLLLRDAAGDLYLVRDPSRLDEASRSHLWAFVD
jgi:hypothetical protein